MYLILIGRTGGYRISLVSSLLGIKFATTTYLHTNITYIRHSSICVDYLRGRNHNHVIDPAAIKHSFVHLLV